MALRCLSQGAALTHFHTDTLTKFGNFIFLLKCLCCCFPSCSIPLHFSKMMLYDTSTNQIYTMIWYVNSLKFYKPKKLLWRPHVSTEASWAGIFNSFSMGGEWQGRTSKSRLMFNFMQMRGEKDRGAANWCEMNAMTSAWASPNLPVVLVDSVDKCHSCISLYLIPNFNLNVFCMLSL